MIAKSQLKELNLIYEIDNSSSTNNVRCTICDEIIKAPVTPDMWAFDKFQENLIIFANEHKHL
jgi:hypothetical protein